MTPSRWQLTGAEQETVAGYEQLRSVALGMAAPIHGRGLALMLRSGMAAWMQAWSEWVPVQTTREEPAIEHTIPIARPEMVSVLTELAISAASEMTA